MAKTAGFLIALLLAGCVHDNIPGTQIEDTPETRTIVELVDQYHQAVENLDAEAILAMVSPDFFEKNGNTKQDDDYGYDALAERLRANFRRTHRMKLDLRVDAIEVEEKTAFAEIYYELRAQVEYPSGLQWESTADRTRLEFERAGDKWLILRGL
jgi:ketosteroid isomerase-like protein